LPFDDESFDVLLAFTVFSSILDPALKVAISAQMQRVLRPAGVILWHDLRVNNPRNRDVRGISRNELMRMFSASRITLEPVTLAPPISRAVWASAGLHMKLSRVSVLCAHYFGLIEKL
jgi:Methyltransferase domain